MIFAGWKVGEQEVDYPEAYRKLYSYLEENYEEMLLGKKTIAQYADEIMKEVGYKGAEGGTLVANSGKEKEENESTKEKTPYENLKNTYASLFGSEERFAYLLRLDDTTRKKVLEFTQKMLDKKSISGLTANNAWDRFLITLFPESGDTTLYRELIKNRDFYSYIEHIISYKKEIEYIANLKKFNTGVEHSLLGYSYLGEKGVNNTRRARWMTQKSVEKFFSGIEKKMHMIHEYAIVVLSHKPEKNLRPYIRSKLQGIILTDKIRPDIFEKVLAQFVEDNYTKITSKQLNIGELVSDFQEKCENSGVFREEE